jgi:hypothetical protein
MLIFKQIQHYIVDCASPPPGWMTVTAERRVARPLALPCRAALAAYKCTK